MEPASLTLSIVSAFGACKAGYKFIHAIQNASSSIVRIQCRCEMEEARFLLWGRSWGLIDDTGLLLPTEHVDSKLMRGSVPIAQLTVKLLEEIVTVLGSIDSVKNKYTQEATATVDLSPIESPRSGHRSVSDTFRRKASSMTLKRRITWSARDKESLTTLVTELHELNDGLYSLLPTNARSLLSDALSAEMLSTKNTQPEIEMVQEISEKDEPVLSSAAGLKLLGLDTHLDDAMWNSLPGTRMPKAVFRFQTFDSETSQDISVPTRATSTSYAMHEPAGGGESTAVLIEWKPYDQRAGVSRAYIIAMRADMLCRLLRKFSSTCLGVLPCLGFFDEVSMGYFGFVFKLPQLPLYGSTSQPLTLNYLMGVQPSLPPLEDRFKLSSIIARTLMAFHCSEWLHKDFSSKNILIATNPHDTSKPDITRPYIIGFTYSRPEDHEGISSEIRQAAADEPLYQHPSLIPIAGQVAPRHSKAFDLWALGCVLLEVGLWRRLDDLWKPKYSESRDKWAERLRRNWTRELRGRCGGTYEEVVNTCLDAHEIIATSQSHLFWNIVSKLESLHV